MQKSVSSSPTLRWAMLVSAMERTTGGNGTATDTDDTDVVLLRNFHRCCDEVRNKENLTDEEVEHYIRTFKQARNEFGNINGNHENVLQVRARRYIYNICTYIHT
jgi:hypothetical protein